MTRPLAALLNSINKQVTITCKDSAEIIGTITEVDEYMNMVLRDAQEIRNSLLKKSEVLIVHGRDIFIIKLENGLDWGKGTVLRTSYFLCRRRLATWFRFQCFVISNDIKT